MSQTATQSLNAVGTGVTIGSCYVIVVRGVNDVILFITFTIRG